MNDVAADLIVANHYSAEDIANKPLGDLVPAILWQCPEPVAAAA